MKTLWLLEGTHSAKGWKALEQDSKEDKVDLIVFDRAAWALVEAEQPPSGYEGLVPTAPEDGMYVSEQGIPIYVVDGREVAGPSELIDALGEAARKLLEEIGDTTTVLERLGKAF
jgi:hypothetical protein